MRRQVHWMLAMFLLGAWPLVMAARPWPDSERTPGGFRLMARSIAVLNANQVFCGLQRGGSDLCRLGRIEAISPAGSGPRARRIITSLTRGCRSLGSLAGCGRRTRGRAIRQQSFFINFRGGGNGEQVQPIYNSLNPNDVANWPAAAYVPAEPNEADNLFHPNLRGRVAASEQDVWWLSWDGNPALDALRRHPLGLLVEHRGMAWNTPSGNQDILYFVYTLYNISSTRVADYVGVRPAMRDILLERARTFQLTNNAAFGITLPPTGYAITNLHFAFAADMDVGDAAENYSSANIPFALGYTYSPALPAA